MEKKCKFSYSNIDDSLIISCKEENENVKENFALDDIVFALTGRGKLVGLQIRNVSNFLLESGIEPAILKNINDIRLIVLQKENSLFIGIKMINKKLEDIKIPLGRVYLPQISA